MAEMVVAYGDDKVGFDLRVMANKVTLYYEGTLFTLDRPEASCNKVFISFTDGKQSIVVYPDSVVYSGRGSIEVPHAVDKNKYNLFYDMVSQITFVGRNHGNRSV